ncbi:MAG: nucleotidyltransferase domain-containing protein [Proteobacteria bacterium]|nr:nucleotidyltransferase domain-containing protein [Pseudomonadota bacterium]
MKDSIVKNPDQLINKIIKRCKNEDDIVAAYLFGSVAMNRMKSSSDLDVALLLESGSESTFQLLQFGTDLEKISGRRVDLVILTRSGELLKYQIRCFGKLIFERDENKRKKFEISGRKRYEDFIHLHNRYVKSVLYGASHG